MGVLWDMLRGRWLIWVPCRGGVVLGNEHGMVGKGWRKWVGRWYACYSLDTHKKNDTKMRFENILSQANSQTITC